MTAVSQPAADAPRKLLRDGVRSLVETRGRVLMWPFDALLRRSLAALGLRGLRSDDRRIFEDRVLRTLAGRRPALDILSIGVRRSTRGDEALLAGHRYRSLDIDPAAARHGSSQGHTVASVVDADRHFAPASFDVVLMNGVFGWGLDRRSDAETAVRSLHRLLRPGGLLVVGWNDIALRRPFAFSELKALDGFEPHRFEGLDATTLALGGIRRHRFEFYRKKKKPQAAAG